MHLLRLGNSTLGLDEICVDADHWDDTAVAEAFAYGIVCRRPLRSLKVGMLVLHTVIVCCDVVVAGVTHV